MAGMKENSYVSAIELDCLFEFFIRDIILATHDTKER
jgi:hypothetical protein